MAASAWAKYNTFPLYLGQKKLDLSLDTFKMALLTSASNANDPTQALYGDLTHELSTANGYTVGGVTLTGVTLTQVGATLTFSCNPAVWNASGAGITARYAVIYDSTPSSPLKPLLAFSLLDTTPADLSASPSTTLTITIDPSGVFTLDGM